MDVSYLKLVLLETIKPSAGTRYVAICRFVFIHNQMRVAMAHFLILWCEQHDALAGKTGQWYKLGGSFPFVS
jgi:hypothetical protein